MLRALVTLIKLRLRRTLVRPVILFNFFSYEGTKTQSITKPLPHLVS